MSVEHFKADDGSDYIDNGQHTYKVSFNPDDEDPTALRTNLFDAFRLLDTVHYKSEEGIPVQLYAIVVDEENQELDIKTQEHGEWILPMYQRVSINRATGQVVVQVKDKPEEPITLIFTSELLTMVKT
jgi:hypothetical protein